MYCIMTESPWPGSSQALGENLLLSYRPRNSSPCPHSSAALRLHHRSLSVQWMAASTETHHSYITTHPRLGDHDRRGDRKMQNSIFRTQQTTALMSPRQLWLSAQSTSQHGQGREAHEPQHLTANS